LAYEQWSRALSREGFLLCHTCCDMEHRFFWSHPMDFPIRSPLILWHTRGCGGPILTQFLMGPHSVASYNKQEDLIWPKRF
jgi:hypothetical protein